MLSQGNTQRYWDDGFVFPIPVFTSEEARAYRDQLEAIERDWAGAELPRPLAQYIRSHSETVFPFAAQMAQHPATKTRSCHTPTRMPRTTCYLEGKK